MVGALVLTSLFSIQVGPIISPEPKSYTWRVNPDCRGVNASLDIQYLNQSIDLTPYVHGCGSFVDGIKPYPENKALKEVVEDGTNMWISTVYGLVLGLLFFMTVLSLMIFQCADSRKLVEDCKVRVGYAWMIIFGVSLLLTGIYLICAGHLYDRTWLCRSYIVETNTFGELVDVYVGNVSPDRGGPMITDPQQWSVIEAVVARCPNVQKNYGKTARWISIPFEASEEVTNAINTAISKSWTTWSGCCIFGIFFMLVVDWFMIRSDEQKEKVKMVLRHCFFRGSARANVRPSNEEIA